jgi:hypothetical protein
MITASPFTFGYRPTDGDWLPFWSPDSGMYETDYWFYSGVAARITGLLALVLFTVFACSGWTAHMLGAVAFGVFLQQLAFVGHDLGHNAVTHDSTTDRLIALVCGNLLTGISVAWWCVPWLLRARDDDDDDHHHHHFPSS